MHDYARGTLVWDSVVAHLTHAELEMRSCFSGVRDWGSMLTKSLSMTIATISVEPMCFFTGIPC